MRSLTVRRSGGDTPRWLISVCSCFCADDAIAAVVRYRPKPRPALPRPAPQSHPEIGFVCQTCVGGVREHDLDGARLYVLARFSWVMLFVVGILAPDAAFSGMRCVTRPPPRQMYKNSQLSLENINADKEIKAKVRNQVNAQIFVVPCRSTYTGEATDCGATGRAAFGPFTNSTTTFQATSPSSVRYRSVRSHAGDGTAVSCAKWDDDQTLTIVSAFLPSVFSSLPFPVSDRTTRSRDI